MAGKSARQKPPIRVEFDVPQRMDGLAMLGQLEDAGAALAFFDPQYRNVLDKLSFGNEGVRQARRAALPAMTDKTIVAFIAEIGRVLRPGGHLVLWMDKFCLASTSFRRWFRDDIDFATVDLMTWNKMRIGMGRRFRSQTEFALLLQKFPTKAQDVWTDHTISDCWSEHADRDIHPHAKPHRLTEAVIRACTRPGDLVVDPCAGGFGVLDACRASGRRFVGCDLEAK